MRNSSDRDGNIVNVGNLLRRSLGNELVNTRVEDSEIYNMVPGKAIGTK